jgi:hypothetical protein
MELTVVHEMTTYLGQIGALQEAQQGTPRGVAPRLWEITPHLERNDSDER